MAGRRHTETVQDWRSCFIFTVATTLLFVSSNFRLVAGVSDLPYTIQCSFQQFIVLDLTAAVLANRASLYLL